MDAMKEHLDDVKDEINELINAHCEVVRIDTLQKVIEIIADVTSDIMNGYLNDNPECNGAYENNVKLIKRINDLIPANVNFDPNEFLSYQVFFAEKRKIECE
jgi:phosphoglycerate-specific signal transduction histidine kinase